MTFWHVNEYYPATASASGSHESASSTSQGRHQHLHQHRHQHPHQLLRLHPHQHLPLQRPPLQRQRLHQRPPRHQHPHPHPHPHHTHTNTHTDTHTDTYTDTYTHTDCDANKRRQRRRLARPSQPIRQRTSQVFLLHSMAQSIHVGRGTTVRFQWGTTTSYGHTTPTKTQTGNTSRPITANISGLSASHLYHFRIVATNGGGTSFGPDRTFTTLSATGPPVVTTNPATNVTTSSARLNGSLDPHGLRTTVYFKWGTTTRYGHTTAMQTQTGNTTGTSLPTSAA